MPDSRSAHTDQHVASKRIIELDGVRGIAIASVLLFHLFAYTMLRAEGIGAAHWAARLTKHGGYGVDLFFVLSGFLITGILLDTRRDPHYFRNFYGRRALRILPLYYTVLLVILLAYRSSSSYVLLSFFHLSNIAPILGIQMFNGAMWSLSVEEHFYLLWPLAVRTLSLRRVAAAAAIVCVAEPVIRGVAFPHVATVFPYSWFRFDGIASGALIAVFVRSNLYSRKRALKAALVLAFVGIAVEAAGSPWHIRQHETQFGAIFEYPPVNLICAALVLWAVTESGQRASRFLRAWPLTVCGDLSYCLYLAHMMVMNAYDGSLEALGLPSALTSFQGVALRAAAVLSVSFLIAAVSRRYLERPALRLRRLFEPRVPNDEPAVVGIRSIQQTPEPA